MATSPDTTRYFNGLYNDGVGLTSVGSYQIAGTPYLSSSTLAATKTMKFTLPAVSKRLYIENTTPANADTSITLSFQPPTDTGVASLGHIFTINSPFDVHAPNAFILSGSSTSIDMDIKCTEFYLTAGTGGTVTYQIYAELTGIAPKQMFELSGSGINNV
jgi:hypothetical protein